jgi:hypothetical protein
MAMDQLAIPDWFELRFRAGIVVVADFEEHDVALRRPDGHWTNSCC